MMSPCIRLERECADIREACRNVCKKHEHDHCKQCACAEACRKMAS